MRALPLLMIITVASAEINGVGGQTLSTMKIEPKKDWWGNIILKSVPRTTIPENLRKSLYQVLSRYPQFSMFNKGTGEKQSIPILATIIGRRFGRRKFGATDETSQNDDHAVKTRALFITFQCPSDTVNIFGSCKPKKESNDPDYDYTQFLNE